MKNAHSLIRTGALVPLVVGLLLVQGCSRDTAPSLLESGKTYIASKDYKSAILQFKASLQLDPQSAEARFLLGKALLESGNPADATLELNKALDLKYDDNKVVPALAKALLLGGDEVKVTTLFGDKTLTDPRALAALKSTVATAWGAQGNRERTEAAIAAATQAAPDFPPALILNARLLAGRADMPAALAILDKVLAADATLAEAWVLKGEILQFDGKNQSAADEAFRKALAQEKAYLPAHQALFSSRLRAKDFAGAKAQLEGLRAVLPKHPQTAYLDAQLAFFSGDLSRAREITQQLLRGAPSHVGVLLLAGVVESQLGSPVSAETHLAKALQIRPDLEPARRNLAEVYLRQGRPGRALETLQPMLQATPPRADALALAGDARLRMGDAAGAETYFREAAKVDPTDTRAQTAAVLARLSLGDAARALADLEKIAGSSADTYADRALVAARLRRREHDAALAAVDALARKSPNDASTFNLRGEVQMLRKDFPASRAAFEQALKLDPSLYVAVANLARVDVAEGKRADAVKRLTDRIASDPRSYQARMDLTDLLETTGGSTDDLKRLVREAITIAPSEPFPRLRLIDMTLKKRQYKEALAAAQEALAALPNNLQVLDAVGRAQLESGDVEQAIVTFRRMAGATPNSALAYTRLADVFRMSGKRSQAENVLRKALEIEPGLADAQANLMELMLADRRDREALEFVRSLQIKPNTAVAGYLLESALQIKAKNPDASLAALRKGLDKTGNSSLARENYRLLLYLKRDAEADRFATTWSKAHPDDHAFGYQMAVNHIARGQLDQAEALLRQVVVQEPNHPLVLNNLAWVLAWRGKPGAVAYAQRAVDVLPDRPALIDTLAMALAAEKQFPEALAAQKRAIALAPNDNTLHLSLARIAVKAGEKELAKTELTRLRELGKKFAFQEEVDQLMKSL